MIDVKLSRLLRWSLRQAPLPISAKSEIWSWDQIGGKPEVREGFHIRRAKPVSITIFIHRPPASFLWSL